MEHKPELPLVGAWARDYFHAARGYAAAFLSRQPPAHYLGHVEEGKSPIILIPGVYTEWHFLQLIADPLSLSGHPVYMVEKLGYNTAAIPDAARIVRELIDERGLRDVIIIAHSKGGLIAKYLLVKLNGDGRIRKVIAIATPFAGSELATRVRLKTIQELAPTSDTIRMLAAEKQANRAIVSIFGTFDNHVWPTESCRLEGAKNIQIDVFGHHAILDDPRIQPIIQEEVR